MAGAYKHARGVLPPGARIGRFELVRRLAKGGMAELYLARALGIHGFEKLVVLKLVLAHLAEDRQFVDMFLGEARLAATLDHPNIVHVTDIGEVGGEPFFVMEYVHGQDLRSVLRFCTKQKRKLSLPVALTTVAGAAAGLHYVHEKRDPDGKFLGLVHRDISPSNVMLSFEGGIKLVDFGIAKATEVAQATRAGVLKGKVNYMAPEQCDGKPIDRRTDVFALGIMLYETTLGRRMFAGDNDYHVMSRIVRGVFAKPSELQPHYPGKLEQIILRCLSIDPDDRYATAQDVLKAIEEFAQEERISLSTLVVADFLRDLYGDQPLPTGDDGEDTAPTALHPDARSAVKAISAIAAESPPGATGVVSSPLEATGVIGGSSPGREPSTGLIRPGVPTRIESAGSKRDSSTALIDKTKRIPVEMTRIAPAPVPSPVVVTPLERTERASVVASPLPAAIAAALDDSGPLVPPPNRSRVWLGVAVILVAAVGLTVVVSQAQAPASGTVPTSSSAEVVPAAAQPAAARPAPKAPVEPPAGRTGNSTAISDSSPGDVPAPAVAEPPPAVADAADSPSAEAVEVVPELEPEPRKRRTSRKRRRGGSKKRGSSTSKGSKGLDAMYPGSK